MRILRAWMVIAMLGVACGGAVSPEEAKQETQAQKLIQELRSPRLSPEARSGVYEQLLGLGEAGPRRLAAYVAHEFPERRTAYLSQFEKAASAALRARVKPGAEQEVASLRNTVLTVSASPALTKEMIVQKADPALKRLEEVLTIGRDEVLAAAPSLKERRDEMLGLLGAYAKAAEKLPAERRKTMNLPEAGAVEAELSASEDLAALMATPMKDTDRRVLLGNVSLARELDPEEAKGILRLNRIRIVLGLEAQSIDLKLCAAGRDHSKDMKEKGFFDHRSPVAGKEDPWKRAKRMGTSAAAENIYQGSGSGEEAIRGWWHSPGHHKNMVARHRRTGLGRTGEYWTQMFGD